MSEKPPQISTSRRRFLKSTLVGSGSILTGLAAIDAFAKDPAPVDFKFVVISDTHFGHPGDIKRFYRALPFVKREKADFILHTGDVVNDHVSNKGELRAAKRALRRVPKPFYVIPGNHDVGWSDDRHLLEIWSKTFGPTEISFTHKGWTFVGLNTTALTERTKNKSEEDRIFAWLEIQAPAFPKGRTIFFYHMPNYKLPVNWSWLPDWSESAKRR
ncbi:MAG: metallophosphoesterase, partial [Myxococcales bacterium]|nr:metallophosphoesterase [Myxococcales bacterium]